MRDVFLIGFMGAGKSTVGRVVAERLGAPFVDLDEEIERAEGTSVGRLFESGGEPGFRDAERRALRRVAAQGGTVVACGGGCVTDEGCRTLLDGAGPVVYLRVTSQEALARVGSDTTGRPLLRNGDPSAVADLLRSREALYEAAADLIVDTSERTPDEIADEIVAGLERTRR
jgi:shikimate kinase